MNESTDAGRAKMGGGGGGEGGPGEPYGLFLSALFKERIISGTGEREAGVLE
jgi:hypothetical protein